MKIFFNKISLKKRSNMAANDSPQEVVCKSFGRWDPECSDLLKTCQQTPTRQVVLCRQLPGAEKYIRNAQCEIDTSSINMESSSLRLDNFLRNILEYQRIAEQREEEDEDLYI